jgi:ABC-type phosphate transport system permease subunit
MLTGLLSIGAGGFLIFLGYDASSCENVTLGGRLLFCTGNPSALEASSGVSGALAGSALMFVGVLLIFVGLTRVAQGKGLR